MKSFIKSILGLSVFLLVPAIIRWKYYYQSSHYKQLPPYQSAIGANKSLSSLSCQYWAVVSLHKDQLLPLAVSQTLSDWCLLVLADTSPPRSDVSSWGSVMFLDSDWYRQWCTYRICENIHWDTQVEHRKNIGYLYVMEHGAKMVLDLDSRSTISGPIPILTEDWVPVTYPTGLVWNPYPTMTNLTTTYPRGFPNSYMKEQEQLSEAWERIPGSSVGIIQSLSRTIPSITVPLLAVSLKTFVALPSTATIFTQETLWGLFLTKTKSGCSPDITRGYLIQKLLWRLGKNVVFTSNWASHPKSLSDAGSEEFNFPLDKLNDLVLDCLDIESCLTQIYSNMSGSCIVHQDVKMLNDWFLDLKYVGYSHPPLKTRKQFAFLAQGGQFSSVSHPRLRLADPTEEPNYDAYFLSFRHPSGDLFFPNSSWQAGRNALLRIALAKEIYPGYEYFVFMDEDLHVDSINDNPGAFWKEDMASNPWRRFEEWLLHFRPKIGFGVHINHQVAHMNIPYDVMTSYDEILVAYHRTSLEIALPVRESRLDWLSSWNQAVVMFFINRLFYSASSFQCNSVMATNTGSGYHRIDDDPNQYSYRQGISWPEIQIFIREHFNSTIEPNPLESILTKLETLLPLSVFGQMELDLDMFNITERETFGFGLHTEMLKYFNLCGTMFKAQARWWKSNLCKHVWSEKIENTIHYIENNCG